MRLNLEEIWARYETALEARPAKGPWTAENTTALADSVADIPSLVKELETLRHATDFARIAAVPAANANRSIENIADMLIRMDYNAIHQENKQLKRLVHTLRNQ